MEAIAGLCLGIGAQAEPGHERAWGDFLR